MKRVFALIFIPLLIFCGCGAENVPRLSEEEYKEAVMSAWEEFRDAQAGFLMVAVKAGDDFALYKGSGSELQPKLDTMRAALEKFEKMNPPEKYEELHKKLVKSIGDEKRWITYREESLSADTKESSDKALDKISEEVNAMQAGETMPAYVMELYRQLGAFESK